MDLGKPVKVLCLNGGSSSLKVSLFQTSADGEEELARGTGKIRGNDVAGVRDALQGAIAEAGIEAPDAIGHRLVHGGPNQTDPLFVDRQARERLEQVVAYAPLHLPLELALVDAAGELYPKLPQVACFDTAFHRHLPAVARRLPVAGWAEAAGVRRYGFHGLSYEYVVTHFGADALGRAVVAHLGSGASMAAILHGRSVDTTMGMSPAGGIMMGTRTGDIDPGALVYLMKQKAWGAQELERFVNHEGGLVGVSDGTSSMEQLLRRRASDAAASLAVELFVATASKSIAALATVLGGIQTLVFTGGIGANAPSVRAEICAKLGFLGVRLEEARNSANDRTISADDAAIAVRVVETNEEIIIARHVRAALAERGR